MDQTKDDLSDSGIGRTPRLKDIEANKDTIVEMKGKSTLGERVCTVIETNQQANGIFYRVQNLVWTLY